MSDADLPLEQVHAEPDEPTEGAAPAVFVMHGRGADEEDLLPIAQRLPDTLHVVSLRAPERLRGGFTWYELVMPEGDLHQSQPDQEDFRRSLDLVVESIDEAVDAYGLDEDRIGLLGFSQGGIMSLSLLVEDPSSYEWVVAMHSYLPESHEDRSPEGIEDQPVFVGAGKQDRVIPRKRSQRAAERLREMGADVTFRAYEAPHGVAQAELDDVVEWVNGEVR